MKRLSLLGLLAISTGLLTGCPIFDDSTPTGDCNQDACGVGGGPSTTLPEGTCFAQGDCTGINETCGEDGMCHTGDCTLWGCVGGLDCRAGQDMKAHCIAPGGTGGAGGVSTGGTGGTGGASTGGTGGVSTGGTGGAATGGAGGAGTGGAATGGAATGGAGGATTSTGTGTGTGAGMP